MYLKLFLVIMIFSNIHSADQSDAKAKTEKKEIRKKADLLVSYGNTNIGHFNQKQGFNENNQGCYIYLKTGMEQLLEAILEYEKLFDYKKIEKCLSTIRYYVDLLDKDDFETFNKKLQELETDFKRFPVTEKVKTVNSKPSESKK